MVYLLPFLTVFIWGGNAIVNKMAASVIEPSAMSFYRWFLAVVILTPFCLPNVIKRWTSIKPFIGKLTFLALLGMVLNQSLGYYAGLSTSASNMALITSLVPLMAIFISVPLLSKPISRFSVIGALLALVGLALMLGKGDVSQFFENGVHRGDGIMLVASACYACYCVLLKRWAIPLSTWTMVYMQGVLALSMLIPLWLSSDQLLPASNALPLVAYAGIAASVFAPWMWVKSIQMIGADSSAMFMNLVPVIAIALAATFLGEALQLYHLIGGVLVISGVIIAQIKRRQLSKKSFEIVNPVQVQTPK